MSKANRQKLLIIAAGFLIGVLLVLAPDRKSDAVDANEDAAEMEHDHDHEIEASESSDFFAMDSLDQVFVDEQLRAIESSDNLDQQFALYDSLIKFGVRNNYPPLIAKLSERKAQLKPTEVNWMLAGDNYFKAFRLSKNQDADMIGKAIEGYKKVLSINPDNLAAETAIGVAYVEGAAQMGEMPMKGIGILKEVLNKDPENIDALTNLGYFAIQSGQYEKAVERFETVLSIDPNHAEAYIYLTDIYLSQDQVDKGIETLEKYKSMVKDPLVKQQVSEYITEIRNK